ncbi:MAG: YceI family protein [Bacteroidia bacterium]|nr:YceI family protein [Bacteroidia bacterium]MDW8057619.1 YceI family protein [Bacteroidia bacterium]
MKRYIFLTLTALLVWVSCTQAPQAPQAETQEAQPTTQPSSGKSLKIIPAESKVKAIGTKVTGRHEIAFPIKQGEVSVAEEGCVIGGKVIIDLKGLQVLDLTGDLKNKLESHLRSDDFFLVDKYPEGVFEITGCEKTAKDTVFLSGNLTLRGQTKNIRFPAVLHVHENSLHAVANFNINRQDWGIAYKGKADDLIRDEVNLSLEIVARQ